MLGQLLIFSLDDDLWKMADIPNSHSNGGSRLVYGLERGGGERPSYVQPASDRPRNDGSMSS